MAVGLLALLDDIAVLAKAAASSVDDIVSGAVKASAKSIGVVIDDTAVTPQYVTNISPKRELNVIWRIALGSLRNKFLIILPVAMVLTWVAPWVLPILLIIGGTYLSFEGAEKVSQWLGLHKAEEHVDEEIRGRNEADLEKKIVNSAVRTDLILSTEIMLISLANVETILWWKQLIMLAIIAIFMTVLVYGVVGLLVKTDDFGMYLTTKDSAGVKKFGRSIVKVMPKVFDVIGVIGTIAMLWVGGHIISKSLHDLHVSFPYSFIEGITHHISNGLLAWTIDTVLSAIVGVVLGAVVMFVVSFFVKLKNRFSLVK